MEIGDYDFLYLLYLVTDCSTSIADEIHLNLVRKLAEDCCKYGAEIQNTSTPLVRASTYFGTSHGSIEEERETFLRILGEQVISLL